MHEVENPYLSREVDSQAADSDETAPTQKDAEGGKEHLPPLNADRAFWGMTATQFLGAFNDNVFKQLVLLLALTPAVTPGGKPQDLQGPGMVIFALPFLLFSGIAGYFSERYSKRRVIVLSKVAEIVVMVVGVAAFAAFPVMGFFGLFGALFLMGMQSAFFGPGKYGILPELFRERDLPQANGVILMTTFLAIIFGIPLAGLLLQFSSQVWLASSACVVIAMLGTGTAFLVRSTAPAKPSLRVTPSAFVVPRDVWRSMMEDRPLLWALLASCMFWLVGSVVLPSVNALGKVQLGREEAMTSLLTAAVGVGIAVGSITAGRLSRGEISFTIMRIGVWGIVLTLLLVAAANPPADLLPQAWKWFADPQQAMAIRYPLSMAALVAVGVSTGCFAVPLQVFLQSRAPQDQKGRVIATMNLANWIAIIVGGVIYWGCSQLINSLGWPSSTMFLATALLILPVAVFYHPPDESLR